MDPPERPGPDADASEIAEWMDADFTWAVAEGITDATSDEDSD